MLTIHLIVDDSDRASQWYAHVFGAKELSRIRLPDGRLIHVELDLDGHRLMLADEFPEHGALSPRTTGTVSAVFYVSTDDATTLWQRGLAAGATEHRPLTDAPWGERDGQFVDPFGHRWGVTQRLRELSHEELTAAVVAAMGG